MRNIFLLMFPIILFANCSPRGSANIDIPRSENLVIKNGENEEEYELTIIDPGFQTWFSSHGKPVGFYSDFYYENQNKRYVSSWNELYQRTGGSGPFGNFIDYRPSEDYGLALNYELFWYFRYIESLYGDRYNFPS